QQLIAEADAEEGKTRVEDGSQQFDLVIGRGGVAGAVGEEHSVDVHRLDLGEGGRRGHEVDVDAAFGQTLRCHRFDAEVDGGDAAPLLPCGGDELRFGDRVLVDELGPGHLRGGLNTGQQLRLGSLGGGSGEDAHAYGARLA